MHWKEFYLFTLISPVGLSKWLSGKESTCQAGDMGSIPRLGRCPGEGNSNPLQYSRMGSPMREEPGGLEALGSQRIRHNLATKQQQ